MNDTNVGDFDLDRPLVRIPATPYKFAAKVMPNDDIAECFERCGYQQSLYRPFWAMPWNSEIYLQCALGFALYHEFADTGDPDDVYKKHKICEESSKYFIQQTMADLYDMYGALYLSGEIYHFYRLYWNSRKVEDSNHRNAHIFSLLYVQCNYRTLSDMRLGNTTDLAADFFNHTKTSKGWWEGKYVQGHAECREHQYTLPKKCKKRY